MNFIHDLLQISHPVRTSHICKNILFTFHRLFKYLILKQSLVLTLDCIQNGQHNTQPEVKPKVSPLLADGSMGHDPDKRWDKL